MDPFDAPTTRRTFAKGVAAAVALPLLAPLASCAPAAVAPAAPPTPATPDASAVPAAIQQEAEALTALLRARYGDRLTSEQWTEVHDGVVGNVRAAEQLRRFSLPITIEPAIHFIPFRVGEP